MFLEARRQAKFEYKYNKQRFFAADHELRNIAFPKNLNKQHFARCAILNREEGICL